VPLATETSALIGLAALGAVCAALVAFETTRVSSAAVTGE